METTMPNATDSLALDRFDSPLGALLLAFDRDERLWALDFEDHAERMHGLLRRRGHSVPPPLDRAPRMLRDALERYFAGELAALDKLEVHMGGSDFQRCVWRALRAIPAGSTTTYGRLARDLGRPSASRAVGHANGSNPIGIVVPCHRVIGADGTLTGYAGGIERKRWLLAHEREASLR
jgi:methylated-DNA-[protein]-cysteine S-methyltransferase